MRRLLSVLVLLGGLLAASTSTGMVIQSPHFARNVQDILQPETSSGSSQPVSAYPLALDAPDQAAHIYCRNNPIDNVDPLGRQGWPLEYEAARLQAGVGRPDEFVAAFTSGTPEQRAAAVAILGAAQVRSAIQSVELEQARKEAEFQKTYGVTRGQVGEASLNVALLALPVERVFLGGLEYIGQFVQAGVRLGRVSLGIRSVEPFAGKELARSSLASRPWWRTSLNPQEGSIPNLFVTESPATVDRVRAVAQKGFDYAVANPRVQGLNRMGLGKDAELQATRWLRRWAERNDILLGEGGLQFQVRGANSIPDLVFDPAKQIFDFKLTPKAVRPAQSMNFETDFPDYDIDYIFGPGPWR